MLSVGVWFGVETLRLAGTCGEEEVVMVGEVWVGEERGDRAVGRDESMTLYIIMQSGRGK